MSQSLNNISSEEKNLQGTSLFEGDAIVQKIQLRNQHQIFKKDNISIAILFSAVLFTLALISRSFFDFKEVTQQKFQQPPRLSEHFYSQLQKYKRQVPVFIEKLRIDSLDKTIKRDIIKNQLQKRKTLIEQFNKIYSTIIENLQNENKTKMIELVLVNKGDLKKSIQLKHQLDILQIWIDSHKESDKQDKKIEYSRIPNSLFSPFMIKLARQPPIFIPCQHQISRYDQKKDLIITTFAGRKAYLQVLFRHLKKQKDSFWQWHLWVDTNQKVDLQYIEQLTKNNEWIKSVKLQNYEPSMFKNFVPLWRKGTLKNKVYLRIDDDTVWISDNFINVMYEARIKNPQPLFIFPNIINNAIVTYLHQRAGNLKYRQAIQYYFGGKGWRDVGVAKQVHYQFLDSIEKNQTDRWKESFNKWFALNYERISINSFIFFGSSIASIQIQSLDQQQFFSTDAPYYYGRKNMIISDAICVHQAFYTQRQFIDGKHPEILKRYRSVVGL